MQAISKPKGLKVLDLCGCDLPKGFAATMLEGEIPKSLKRLDLSGSPEASYLGGIGLLDQGDTEVISKL